MQITPWLMGCDVRTEDRIGNDGADTAADLGRMKLSLPDVLLFVFEATGMISCFISTSSWLLSLSY